MPTGYFLFVAIIVGCFWFVGAKIRKVSETDATERQFFSKKQKHGDKEKPRYFLLDFDGF